MMSVETVQKTSREIDPDKGIEKMKILISDPLGDKGLELLKEQTEIEFDVKPKLDPEELKNIIGNYDALLVRSGTKVTAELIEKADRLKVIGRAGVGVDNVDIKAATKKGIIVMNTPEGNTISTCEHTVSMLLSLNRNIPQAHVSVRDKEWKRGKFQGSEIYGKTLGVVGFGRIGREVAKRLQSFGMNILAYDPFIAANTTFSDLSVEITTLDEIYAKADYITLHTPLTNDTKHMLNKKTFAQMKDGVRIINCARGGIINEKDLYDAIKSGKVKGAALDVFESEPPLENPLLDLDEVIATPHLGASTAEAQENVSVAVVKQVVDVLLGREIKNAVNMPSLDIKSMEILRPWIKLAEKLGKAQAQLFAGSIKEVNLKYSGEVTQFPLAPLTLAAVKGLLEPFCGEGVVNYVNAPLFAKERGITINESKTSQLEDFANFISVEIVMDKGSHVIVGTLFGKTDSRIVKIDNFFLDAVPKGNILVVENEDKPGVVGEIGTILANNNINIAEMTLGRNEEGAKAITVINTDSDVSSAVLDEIKSASKVIDVKLLSL